MSIKIVTIADGYSSSTEPTITSPSIPADSIDGDQLRLDNNQALRARNNADSADVELFKLNIADEFELITVPKKSGSPIASLADLSTGLSTKLDTAEVGNTVASLVSGKVPAGQLPSYVDDVLNFADLASFPVTGDAGVIYIADDTNASYRWTGSIYVSIGTPIASTDDVTEGATNLYYTNVRADARVAVHAAVTNTHGATGAVVGTTNTQTLTNKTLTGASIESPIKLEPKLDTYANLVTYASGSTNGQFCFSTDTKTMYQVVDGLLASVGGGSAGLSTVFQLMGKEQITDWATGDNASIGGGGTLSGTFAFNATDPLQFDQDYKYTQAAGSLNDYFLGPAQDVDVRFRAKECTLLFPYMYDGASNDIEVLAYDVTNASIIPTSMFIQATGTSVAIFKANITIPATCDSIIIGFQTKVLNSGKIFRFASVEMTSDTTVYANTVDADSFDLASGTTRGSSSGSVIVSSVIKSPTKGIILYRTSAAQGTEIVALRPCTLTTTFSAGRAATNHTASIRVNGTVKSYLDIRGTSDFYDRTNGSISLNLNAGDIVTYYMSADPTAGYVYITGTAISSNQSILTAPDTFSTDTNPLTYASSAAYTLSTLSSAPIGTFITFTYAASTNTRTQTTTAPTQDTSDMSSNGILLYARNYTSASTALQPAAFAIQIGKGLKGLDTSIYKSAGKSIAGALDYYESGSFGSGARIKGYESSTGVLLIDLGYVSSGITHSVEYTDLSTQASGYAVINASKNPAMTGISMNDILPAGMIMPFAGAVSPVGFLACDGASLNRADYPRLFAAIGTAHGTASGTTFNLPDYRGRFLRGVTGASANDPDAATRTAAASGGNTGNNVGSVQADANLAHNHGVRLGSTGGAGPLVTSTGGWATNNQGSTPTTDTGGSEARPKNAYVNYIIKT